MKYGAFTKNNRVVFVENYVEFSNNLGLYLYFSQSARFLNTATFTADSLPVDIYNYQIVDEKLVQYNPIKEEHIVAILKLQNDLNYIKSNTEKSARILLETYGNSNLGSYITSRIKTISEKIVNNHQLTDSEKQLFEYQKSKYDNVDDVSMAKMLLMQVSIWESRLDNSILNLIKNLDQNISGGF